MLPPEEWLKQIWPWNTARNRFYFKGDPKTFFTYDTHIGFGERDLAVKAAILDTLRDAGYKTYVTPRVAKNYDCLAKTGDYISGHGWKLIVNSKGDKASLQFNMETHPGTSHITFFQNFVTENKYGGEHDHSKLGRMPYLMKIRFLDAQRRIYAVLRKHGYTCVDPPARFPSAAHEVYFRRKIGGQDWHAGSYANHSSLDGRWMYFYDYHGNIGRGQVFYNLNNMYLVFSGGHDWTLQLSEGRVFENYGGVRRNPTSPQGRRESLLKKAFHDKDYRAIARLAKVMAREVA